MAKRPPAVPEPSPSNIPLHAIPGAIRKLEKRLSEIQSTDPAQYKGDFDDLARSLCSKLNATAVDVFGAATSEAERLSMETSSFIYLVMVFGGEPTPRHREIQAFRSGQESAISKLNTEIDILKERLEEDDADTASKSLRAYENLDLHPTIQEAASDLFRDKHYANAIEDAVKALNAHVRYKSGLEIDGVALMERAFGPANPVLRFNDLADQSDKDEQKGFMQMFSGAVSGLRNPRAHKLIKDDPERALEFIAFVSLLAKLVDRATKVRSATPGPSA